MTKMLLLRTQFKLTVMKVAIEKETLHLRFVIAFLTDVLFANYQRVKVLLAWGKMTF